MGFTIGNLTRLTLGWQGESKSRLIDIDMSEWLRDWPEAAVDMLVQRPGEEKFYPVYTTVRGGHLLWTPTRADVMIAGNGKAQIILTDKNDVELRSRVVQTIIGESLIGTEGEAPDPVEGWVHEVLQAANDIKQTIIEEDVPDPSKAHMQLVSNAIGEAEWDRRECYTSRPVVFPRNMEVDADAPAAIIYEMDGGADTNLRWVKVSDYAPAQSEVIGRATTLTSGYGTQKVAEENILGVAESGYLIARDRVSTSTSGLTRTLRTVYAVVCFKGGYVAHGHPGIQPVDDYSSTISVPGLYLPVSGVTMVTACGLQFDEYVQQLDEKYIPDSIARKKDLENVINPELPEQVTDERINALIDAKLSAFGMQTILAEKTLLGEDDDGDGVNDNFYVTGAWDTVPAVGSAYDVYYNGTKYPCEAVAMPEDTALAPGAMAMGNLAVMGIDGLVGNPDAPFLMVCLPEPMDGIVGMLMPTDGATAVTLSIRCENVGYYYYDGSKAKIVTIDQLKAALGLGGGDTTTDVFYTADGQIFTDVNGAVMHIQKGDQ